MKENIKFLSASRIKTLQSCSWLYYCNYGLSLPQKPNSGALRGTICHLVFELLLKKRHLKHYNAIIAAQSISGSKGVDKLIKKNMTKVKLDPVGEDYDLIDKMTLVGLNHDFFCEGGEIVSPEYEFTLLNQVPQFKIKGFIDKPVIYKDEKIIKICDYKSSKAKFRGEELKSNIQAMLYSLAAKKLWPDLKPVVQFIFLRFPKSPIQELEFTDSQLRGFAYWLEQLNRAVDTFDEKKAKSNFAGDHQEYRWMCKAGKTWECPYMKGFDYWAVEEGSKVVKTSFVKEELKATGNQQIVKKVYTGCPKFVRSTQTAADEDDFNF